MSVVQARHARSDVVSRRIRAAIVALLLLAVVLITTPFVLQALSQMQMERIVDAAQEKASAQSASVRAAELRRARAYNKSLVGKQSSYGMDPSKDYMSQLDSQSVMATLYIPSIHVDVPVYHTTDDDALKLGAGHLYGTSLPVGGRSTHSVIAAHNGNPSSRLFTNLNQLVDGDLFRITVDGKDLWYKVDSEMTMLPEDVRDHVSIVPGEDRVTLLTCTPYGVNTHRLLVSGVRTDAPAVLTAGHYSFDPLLPVAIVLLLVIAGIITYALRPRGYAARHSISAIGGLSSVVMPDASSSRAGDESIAFIVDGSCLRRRRNDLCLNG